MWLIVFWCLSPTVQSAKTGLVEREAVRGGVSHIVEALESHYNTSSNLDVPWGRLEVRRPASTDLSSGRLLEKSIIGVRSIDFHTQFSGGKAWLEIAWGTSAQSSFGPPTWQNNNERTIVQKGTIITKKMKIQKQADSTVNYDTSVSLHWWKRIEICKPS